MKDFNQRRNDKRLWRSANRKPLMSVLQSKPMESGAGGNWRRFGEKFDESIVKQSTGVSCVSAVGEMLLKKRGISVSQEQIRDIIGEPAYVGSLARCLNRLDESDDGREWRGFASDEESLDVLLKQKELGVILVEPHSRIGHAVIVDGKTRSGFIRIKDPFDQTSYKMRLEDFKANWGGEVILRWYREK